jgi:hypothetical protein
VDERRDQASRYNSPPVVRLFLRTLVLIVVTLLLASLLSTLVFVVVVLVFGGSDDVFVDFGDGWPVFLGCVLLAAVVVWRFLPIRRSDLKG